MKEQIKRIIKFIALSLIHFKKSIENIKNNNDNVLNTYVETRLNRLKNRYIDWDDSSGTNSNTIKTTFFDKKYKKNNNFKANTGIVYLNIFTNVSNISIPQSSLPSYKAENRKYLVDIKYILKPSTWDKTPSTPQAVKTEGITKTISLQNSSGAKPLVTSKPLFVKKWSSQKEEKPYQDDTKKVKRWALNLGIGGKVFNSILSNLILGWGGWVYLFTGFFNMLYNAVLLVINVSNSNILKWNDGVWVPYGLRLRGNGAGFELINGENSITYFLKKLKMGVTIDAIFMDVYKELYTSYIWKLASSDHVPYYGNGDFTPTDIATKLGGKPFLLNDRDRFLLTFEEGGEITSLNISINGDTNKIVEKVIVKIETCSDYLNS